MSRTTEADYLQCHFELGRVKIGGEYFYTHFDITKKRRQCRTAFQKGNFERLLVDMTYCRALLFVSFCSRPLLHCRRGTKIEKSIPTRLGRPGRPAKGEHGYVVCRIVIDSSCRGKSVDPLHPSKNQDGRFMLSELLKITKLMPNKIFPGNFSNTISKKKLGIFLAA